MSSIMEPSATLTILIGNPTLRNWLKVILWPFISAKTVATMPALELMIVPFPPNPTPSDNAHHNGLIGRLPNTAAIESVLEMAKVL